MPAAESEKSTLQNVERIERKVDSAAITRYKHRIDAKIPIRERDLRYPSKSSLIGCFSLKLALVFVIAGFLVMRSLGLDGQPGYQDPITVKMIFGDLAYGWCVYGIVSGFTYLYLRIKNPAWAVLLFFAGIVLTIIAFLVWGATAEFGGLILLPIFLTVCGIVPFLMDIYGLITFKPGQPVG